MRTTFAVAFAAWMFATTANADETLFEVATPLQLAIEAPFARLINAAPRSTDPWPATLRLGDRAIPLELAPRGVSRRTHGICSFPPLALVVARGAAEGSPFAGERRLKLVSHCKPTPAFEQQTVREYVAYRLYNLVTPLSFRVRPLDIVYRDSERPEEDRTRFAFLIESASALGRRNERDEMEVKVNTVSYAQLDPAATTRAALFRYMIGDLDWDFVSGHPGDDCCHNTKLFARPGHAQDIAPAPYDFDFSGFVDAPYASPPDNVPVHSVRQRFYRGPCRFREAIPAVAAEFRARRADMMALIEGEPRLNGAGKRALTRYLNSFFATLDDPAAMDRAFTARCR
jgi:hypothetical protein